MILLDALVQDIIWEVSRFVVMGALIVAGSLIGIRIRKRSDAKKAALLTKDNGVQEEIKQ